MQEPFPPAVFKIFRAAEWAEAAAMGRFEGSADDRRDGFIHLSTAPQLDGTLARHFTGADGLVLARFSTAALGPALKWEASRGGALFPHLYAALPINPADPHWALALDAADLHILPEGLE